MITMRKFILYVVLLLLIVSGFSYGILVGRFKIFPYNNLKQIWSSTSGVKKAIAPAIERSLDSEKKSFVETNLIVFELHKFNVMEGYGLRGSGGALAKIGDQIIGVDSEGRFFMYKKGGKIEKLSMSISMNKERFLEYVQEKLERSGARRNADRYFRVLDILAKPVGQGVHLFVSHHFWDDESKTKTMRVSRLSIEDVAALVETNFTPDQWELIFESHPPIPFLEPPYIAITTNHTGGRMALDHDGNLIVGIGEHRFDGISYPEVAAQNDTSSYGKLIRIDLRTLKASLLAKGVRNPQGLLLDREGNLWETEHGPRGGDELNLIREGGNYGWPMVTYGTEEGKYTWPHNKHQGRHDGYIRPIYAWVPSIGISNLIQFQGDPGEWDGDLLVSSLAGLSLYRIRVEEGRVVFAEQIRIGERIRDLEQLEDGTILIFADNARFVELRPVESPQASSELLAFTEEEKEIGLDEVISTCATCHGFNPASSGVTAPALWGVFGRKIGGSDFANYSESLRKKNGAWNEKSLRAFIADPQGFAPGTTMPDSGIEDEETLRALIDYLRRLN
jgi:cytochrome c2